MENEQTPPTLTEKKKVKVSKVQAADPGVYFFLETESGKPFDSPLKIFIKIEDENNNKFNSRLHIMDKVVVNNLNCMIPFGDAVFNQSFDYTVTISVNFTNPADGSPEYTVDTIPVSKTDRYFYGDRFNVGIINLTPIEPSGK